MATAKKTTKRTTKASPKADEYIIHANVLTYAEIAVLNTALVRMTMTGVNSTDAQAKIAKDLIERLLHGKGGKRVYKTVCLYRCSGTDFPWQQVSVRATSSKPDEATLNRWEKEELDTTAKECMKTGFTKEEAYRDHEFMFFTVEC